MMVNCWGAGVTSCGRLCLCGRKLKYGSSGKKALRKHAKDPVHKASVRALSHTTILPGASATGNVNVTTTSARVYEHRL